MISTRASIFYGLNAIRVLSIVALLLVFASSIFVMVNDVEAVNRFDALQKSSNGTLTSSTTERLDYIEGSTVPNQAAGVFWAVVQRFLIIFEVIILILAEVGWFVSFFERYFPVLAPSFGLGALGIFQGLIGATILSHHVDDFTLVAGFFLFSVGCVNMLVGLIFREGAKTKRCITTWRNEARGILPSMSDSRPVFTNVTPNSVKSMFTGHSNTEHADMFNNDMYKTPAELDGGSAHIGYGFGRQGEKQAGLKGFLIARPIESLPRYASPSPRPASIRSASPARSASSLSSASTRSSRDSSRASSPERPTRYGQHASHFSVPSRFSSLSRSGSAARSPRFENAPPMPTQREVSPARSESSPVTPPGLDTRPRYQLSDAPRFQSSTTAI